MDIKKQPFLGTPTPNWQLRHHSYCSECHDLWQAACCYVYRYHHTRQDATRAKAIVRSKLSGDAGACQRSLSILFFCVAVTTLSPRRCVCCSDRTQTDRAMLFTMFSWLLSTLDGTEWVYARTQLCAPAWKTMCSYSVEYESLVGKHALPIYKVRIACAKLARITHGVRIVQPTRANEGYDPYTM